MMSAGIESSVHVEQVHTVPTQFISALSYHHTVILGKVLNDVHL